MMFDLSEGKRSYDTDGSEQGVDTFAHSLDASPDNGLL